MSVLSAYVYYENPLPTKGWKVCTEGRFSRIKDLLAPVLRCRRHVPIAVRDRRSKRASVAPPICTSDESIFLQIFFFFWSLFFLASSPSPVRRLRASRLTGRREKKGTDVLATVLPKFYKLVGDPSRRRAGKTEVKRNYKFLRRPFLAPHTDWYTNAAITAVTRRKVVERFGIEFLRSRTKP